MRYLVEFEEATAEYDLLRDPPLTVSRDGATSAVAVDPGTGYDGQVRYLIDAIQTGQGQLETPIEDAEHVARLLEAERKSLDSGEWVQPG